MTLKFKKCSKTIYMVRNLTHLWIGIDPYWCGFVSRDSDRNNIGGKYAEMGILMDICT